MLLKIVTATTQEKVIEGSKEKHMEGELHVIISLVVLVAGLLKVGSIGSKPKQPRYSYSNTR
jgi:hypothetical protein